MINHVDLKGQPLYGTGGVLATCVALSNVSSTIFVNFCARVSEGKKKERGRQAWHWVLVVRHSELIGESGVGESGVGAIANSRLSKVYHMDTETVSYEGHAGQLGKCAAQTVTSHLYSVPWQQRTESPNFSKHLWRY